VTKIFTGFLLLVILYTSGGYFIVIMAMQQNIRSEMGKLIEGESNSNGKDIQCLSFSKNEIGKSVFLKNRSEFIWQGNHYDISKEIQKNDSVHFYCIRDKKEENLYSGFRSDLSYSAQSQSTNQPTGSFTFKIFSIGFFFEANKKELLTFELMPYLSSVDLNKASIGYSHLFTPPPKNILS
jgi:hypothetical protein